ncbi:hypothetical protein VUR80DRAFT_1928 [Thermomyces stellatus]
MSCRARWPGRMLHPLPSGLDSVPVLASLSFLLHGPSRPSPHAHTLWFFSQLPIFFPCFKTGLSESYPCSCATKACCLNRPQHKPSSRATRPRSQVPGTFVCRDAWEIAVAPPCKLGSGTLQERESISPSQSPGWAPPALFTDCSPPSHLLLFCRVARSRVTGRYQRYLYCYCSFFFLFFGVACGLRGAISGFLG